MESSGHNKGIAALAATNLDTVSPAAKAYLNSRWTELKEALPAASRHTTRMTAQQRADLVYIRNTAPTFRPAWWKACKSTTEAKFRATIWGRSMVIDYTPSDHMSIAPRVDNQRMKVALKLSWNPSQVDSSKPAAGSLAARRGLPNKTVSMLTEPDDRKYQDKRDAWVKEQLQKAAKQLRLSQ